MRTRSHPASTASRRCSRTAPPPDLWVIALGTNDVANYRPEDYPAAINELLAAIPADAPVLWVDCYLDDYRDPSEQFDGVLRQVLAVRGNARVVDWASVAGEDGVLRTASTRQVSA